METLNPNSCLHQSATLSYDYAYSQFHKSFSYLRSSMSQPSRKKVRLNTIFPCKIRTKII